MRRGLCFSLIGLSFVATLGSLAGCGRSFLSFQEREAWRHEAEVQCLRSGTVKEGAGLVRISPIEGPGICGADFPLKVAALGESNSALGFADDLRPPGSIPKTGPSQPRWPVSQAPRPTNEDIYATSPVYRQDVPPPSYPAPRASDAYVPPAGGETYLRVPGQPQPQYAAPRVAPRAPGAPISLQAPGISDLIENDAVSSYPPDRGNGSVVRSYPPDRPAYNNNAPRGPAAAQPPYASAPPSYPSAPPAAASRPLPALGPSRAPLYTASAGPVEVNPKATLACPIVSALDTWITRSVQPSAMRWFGEPVVEIKQISAYSCRGMNGQPGAKISEHAFGNALDIAAFTLASGRKIVVRTSWKGAPEEQGFLRDIQGAACEQFTTVLAPGSNAFHYDHIHVDLMRRTNRRFICQPAAVSGELVAARAAQKKNYARRGSDPGVTGSIAAKRKLADTPYEDDDHQWIQGDTPPEPPAKPVKVERMRDW